MCDNQSIMCPSNKCKPGSKLLGIRQENGTVSILPDPLPIDENFINTVNQDDVRPEQKFRFTNKCVETGCSQWNGKGCGVIDQVIQYLEHIPHNATLPKCSIRPSCRWFLQTGANACKICPYIITEITEADNPVSLHSSL
jgi:hypothetical protein